MNLLIRKYLPSKTKLIVSLFIFFSILKTAESYSQWILQYNSPLAISDVRFINKKTGWACGNNQILKTTNGGDKWILQSVPTTGYFRQVHPVNDSVVYVCGWYVILKTSDGGNNWNIVRVGQEQAPQLDGLWFNDENTGWFCGDRVVMRTTNGGNTFIDSMRMISSDLNDIHFKDSITGIIVGNGRIFRSTNSGTGWYQVKIPSTFITPFCDRVTFKSDTGWTASRANVVYKTTNYGISWDSITRIADEHTHSTSSIEFSSSVTGYAGGRYGKIFKTTDGGFNWHILQTQQFGLGYYVSIFAYSDSLVWAVGGGNIINTKNGGELLVKIPETGFNEISEFALFQNIPNPFNPTTNIKVIINKSNFVKIIVYNHLGEEVKVLSDKYLKSGEYTFNFDGSSLPSGVYYYKVYTGNYSETKKMILIR